MIGCHTDPKKTHYMRSCEATSRIKRNMTHYLESFNLYLDTLRVEIYIEIKKQIEILQILNIFCLGNVLAPGLISPYQSPMGPRISTSQSQIRARTNR